MIYLIRFLKFINKFKVSIEDKLKNLMITKKEFYLINNSKNQYHMGFHEKKIKTGMRLRIEGKWEPHCSSAIRSLMRDSDNVLQLGSAWGYFTLLMKSMQNQNAYIYAVEAENERAEQLKKNFKKNNFKNWKVMNLFVTKDKGENLSFNDLLNHLDKKIDFLFSDIEGYELDILDDIIDYNIKIRNMVIGYHLVELKSSKKNYFKENKFYTIDELEKRLKKLEKNYYYRFDEDNILFFLKKN